MKDLLLKGTVKMQVLKDTIVNDENGQDLIEYGLLAALIALAAVAGMTSVGTGVNAIFDNVALKLGSAS